MAWTVPTTRLTDDLITSSIWNTDVVDNLLWLKDPTTDVVTLSTALTTSSTTFADMTGLSITITTNGGSVLVGFTGSFTNSNSAAANNITLLVDGVSEGADDGVAVFVDTDVVSFVWLVEGVSAGSHTFKLQWKVSAGTATLYAQSSATYFKAKPQFWVRES